MSHLGPQAGDSDVLVDRASLPPEATTEGLCKTTNSKDSGSFKVDHFQADGAFVYGLPGRKGASGSPAFYAPTYDKRTQKLPPLSSLPLAHHRPAPLRSASHNANVSTEHNLPKLQFPPVPLSTEPVQPTFSVAPPIPFIPTSFGAQKSSYRAEPDLSAERSASRQLPSVVSLLDGQPSASFDDGSSTHLSLRGGAASNGHKTTTTPTSANHKLAHLLDMRHGHNGASTLEYPTRDSMIPPGWSTSGRAIAQRERLLKAAVEAATAVADSHYGISQREHNPASNKAASSDILHITDTADGYRDGFRDGYKEGRKEGFRDERSYREAYKDGFREGRVGGYLDRKQEGYRGGGMVDGALATGLDEEWDIDQYGNLLESFKSKGWRGPSAHTNSQSGSSKIPQPILRPPVEPAPSNPLQIDSSAGNRFDSQLPPRAKHHLSSTTPSSAVSPRSREPTSQTRNETGIHSNDRSPNGDSLEQRASPDESTEKHDRYHRRRPSNGQRQHSGSELGCEKRGANHQRTSARRRDQRNSGSNSSESPDSSEASRGHKRRSPEASNSNDEQNLSSSRSADNSSPDTPSTDRKRKRQSDTNNSSESPESGVDDKRSRKNKKSSSSSSRSGSDSSSRSPTSEGNDSEKKRKRATREQLDLLERVFEQEELPSRARRKELANELGFSPRRIQIWFQNRRAKSKKKEGKQYVMVNYGKHSFRKESRDSSGPGSSSPRAETSAGGTGNDDADDENSRRGN